MSATDPQQPQPYRLSDQERDEAIAVLGEAYAQGRLDVAEFEERMERAGRARFATDLDPLFADLPSRPRTPPPSTPPLRVPEVTSPYRPRPGWSGTWGPEPWGGRRSGRRADVRSAPSDMARPTGATRDGAGGPPVADAIGRMLALALLVVVMIMLVRFRLFLLLIPAIFMAKALTHGSVGGCSGGRRHW